MKSIKIIYLLLIVALLTITSCTPEEETFEDLILGNWRLTHIKGNPIVDCQNQTTLSFDGVESEKIEYEDDPLGSGNCVIYQQLSGPYTINNDVITYGTGSSTSTTDILQLDNTTLELEQHISSNLNIIIKLVRQ